MLLLRQLFLHRVMASLMSPLTSFSFRSAKCSFVATTLPGDGGKTVRQCFCYGHLFWGYSNIYLPYMTKNYSFTWVRSTQLQMEGWINLDSQQNRKKFAKDIFFFSAAAAAAPWKLPLCEWGANLTSSDTSETSSTPLSGQPRYALWTTACLNLQIFVVLHVYRAYERILNEIKLR